MEQEEVMDSLLCETPTLVPTLCLSLPQAPEGPSTAAPAATAAASTSVSSNQGKVVKVSGGRRSEAFAAFKRSSDVPCVRFADQRGEHRPADQTGAS